MTAPPHLAIPRPRARRAKGIALSFLGHAAILAALVWRADTRRAGTPAGGPGGGEHERGRAVNFFALAAPAALPLEADVPPAPQITLAHVPTLPPLALDLPAVAALPTAGGGAGAGAPTGSGTGGTGIGEGSGGLGPGTGSEGDYIPRASLRTAILPPAKVPGSVAGRTYRIRFWVAADGRVTRIEVDPPMQDEGYRREFLDRMMAYRFYPARTRDGVTVASVVMVSLRIGN